MQNWQQLANINIYNCPQPRTELEKENPKAQVCLSLHLSVFLSLCLHVCLSACLPACLPACIMSSLPDVLVYIYSPSSQPNPCQFQYVCSKFFLSLMMHYVYVGQLEIRFLGLGYIWCSPLLVLIWLPFSVGAWSINLFDTLRKFTMYGLWALILVGIAHHSSTAICP